MIFCNEIEIYQEFGTVINDGLSFRKKKTKKHIHDDEVQT